jgi:hypothetical protein
MKIFLNTAIILLLLTVSVFAGNYFPDTTDYKTLICDFHMHTVFSDGLVWPTVRVDEAEREGIDMIVISDHIEYQPHKDDIPTNHNRPFEIVKERAREKNVLLVRAAEITRSTPPGHYNAIYLNDINPLDTPEFLDSIEAANKQSAFVFWNHHEWKGKEKGDWKEVQTTMYDNGWLHGMEVANGRVYYPNAHKWCLEKNMTLIGNSDIHEPSIHYNYIADKHRTLTLVFAKERTVESIKEALKARRTVAWYNNSLIGSKDTLAPLFDSLVSVAKAHCVKDGVAFFEVENKGLIDLELTALGKTSPKSMSIPAQSSKIFKTRLPEDGKPAKLRYSVTNMLAMPEEGLQVELVVSP